MGSHDTLFKHVFSDPDNAAAELRAVLPARIARAVDWSTLRLEPGSFVDSDLAERHCDLLFSADLAGRRAYLYFLFEHRSKPDPWMPLRLAGYVLRIWEDVRRREPERQRLPVVIPVVLHHGPQGWTSARSIAELLDADPRLIAALGDRLGYVSEVQKVDSRSAWIEAVRHAGPEVEEVVVSWIDNMRAEGRAQGQAEGRAEIVLKLLALKFGVLDAATSASVRAATIDELDRIAERVLTATSLDEALGGP
jgi:predicted transposase YdaD